jgi:hypothetical protein
MEGIGPVTPSARIDPNIQLLDHPNLNSKFQAFLTNPIHKEKFTPNPSASIQSPYVAAWASVQVTPGSFPVPTK